MKKSLILCKVVIILVTIEFFGCDTYRTTLPELTALPRHSIVVDPPVLVALFDGRSDAQNSEEITMTLRKDLKQIYGQSIEFTDYFVKIPENRILVRIRIQELGANFGSRIVSNVSVTNSLNKEMESDEIQGIIFDVSKKNNLNTSRFFKILYNIILGIDRGPKLGKLINILGEEKVSGMIKNYISKK